MGRCGVSNTSELTYNSSVALTELSPEETAMKIIETLIREKCGMMECPGNHNLIPTSGKVVLVECKMGMMYHRIECGRGVIERSKIKER
jgi:hypothetical protein